jgi:hypothetical protein
MIVCTGSNDCAVLPFPNWPLPLLPQHCTPPLTTAQLCVSPAETVVTPLPVAMLGIADKELVVLLFPN